jgi:hypothetical protein
MKKIYQCLFISFFCTVASADGNLKINPKDVEQQLPQLTQDIQIATAYSWGVVGTPSAPSTAEIAARKLYKYASAEYIYAQSDGGSIEGQMYLLCLLKKKNQLLYKQAKAKLDVQKTEVTVFSGSVLSKAPTSTILSQIEKFNCSALDWKTK